jgi:hypothetical protein
MTEMQPAAGGEPVQGTPLTQEQLMALAALAGNIEVDITLPSGTAYKLRVAVPTATGESYTFRLTETPGQGTPSDIADFKFKDANNFSVDVRMPEIDVSNTKITAGFHLQNGSP